MNRLRLRLAASLSLLALSAFMLGATVASSGSLRLVILWSILLIAGAAASRHLLMLVLRETRTFVKALEMKAFTVRFPACADALADEIHSSMNRIIALHRDGTNALETRKLYYDRILRIMTHELRNGITPVVALCEDMQRHPDRYTGDNLAEALSVIADESLAVKRFLDSYYELTHLPAPDRREVDATEFFSQIRRAFSLRAAESGVTLEFSIARGMRLDIDPDMMKRVMVNLISNSLEAVRGADDPRITVTASMPGDRPFITVTDNGHGIPAAIMDNLFQPFFTTRPDGNGIGLCLSRQIVRLHGGDLTITSSQTTVAAISL